MEQNSSPSTTTLFSPYISAFDSTYNPPQTLSDVAINSAAIHKNTNFNRVDFVGTKNNSLIGSWVLVSLILGFASIAFVRSAYKKRFSMLFQTLINWKLSKQIIRYEKVYTHPVNIIMTLNFIVAFPLFFAILRNQLFDTQDSVLLSFFIILIPVIGYLIIKLVAHQFMAWLWNQKPLVEEYLFQTNLFNKYLGLGFLILTTIVVYSSIDLSAILYFGLILLILSLVFQIIRGIIIGVESGVKWYLIFLYLCTLEILPWLAIGKWVNLGL